MIEKLKTILRNEGRSLVVMSSGGEVRSFNSRGIEDIYTLYTNETEFLRGAILSDKVIGIGAAAVMISAGVKEAYAEVLSTRAQELFLASGTAVSYGVLVPHIINRKGNGRCPLEVRCDGCTTIEDILQRVTDFRSELQKLESKK
ncbi:MAG: DUF1893 domain-containing protein [Rikenellaceae bacterium]